MSVTETPHHIDSLVPPRGLTRFAGIGPRERSGYGVWLFVGAVIGVAELWAAAGNPWWLTISATVGHLEQNWSPVRIIVVALIVVGAVQMLRYPPGKDEFPGSPRHPARWRTDNGRLTKRERADEIPHAELYFPVAVVVVAAAGAVTAVLGSSKYLVGYVIYGLIAIALLIIPNAMAFWWAKEVPFPTLYRTLYELDKRSHSAVIVVLAGLVVLAIHLVAYPWP